MTEVRRLASLTLVSVGGRDVFVSGAEVASERFDEVDIAAVKPTLDAALSGIFAFAKKVSEGLNETDVTQARVTFACEFAVEAGSVLAIIGKASASSALTVELQWTRSGSSTQT
jgi:NTP-dependent ternary system trypsin peptidase co-occuring protein